ncbi:hypothetical protein MBANPS3_002174 [Mucor bainieri]
MSKIYNNLKYQQQQQQQSQVPRPLNCFLMYRLEKQKEIVAKCPTANHRDISKIIAKWWQDASDEEKEPFREKARLAKEQHNALYPDYKYAPKKKVTPKRVYIRRNKKQQFTSRATENNKLMEMIYEDPSALKHFSPSNIKTFRTRKPSAKVRLSPVSSAKVPLSPVSTSYSTAQVDVDSEYACDSSYCSVSPPLSFASYSSSSTTTPFDSPYMSPYSDYSEFEISSPVSSCETVGCYSPPPPATTTPLIGDLNDYATDMNYDMEMMDYFHFDHSDRSNTNDTFMPYTTQEFSRTEPCDALAALTAAEQYRLYRLMTQVSEPPVKYINPALLQLR